MQVGLEILHLGDMFRLLATVPIGRIGFMADDEVAVLPVRFLVDGQDVVFRTYVGSKLSNIEVGHYVCFEVDSYDADKQTGWSVVARGLVEKESEAACARLDAPGLESWGGDRPRARVDADQARRRSPGGGPRRPTTED